MKKRIQYYIITTSASSLIIFIIFCFFWVNFNTIKNVRKNLDDTLKTTIYLSENIYESIPDFVSRLSEKISSETRITIVDRDGNVIADTYESQLSKPNHRNRPEIVDAFDNGYGEHIRHSETVGEDYFYVARIWKDNYVIRFSTPISDVYSFLKNSILLFIVIISIIITIVFFISKHLSNKALSPYYNFIKLIENTMEDENISISFISEFEEFEPAYIQLQALFNKLSLYINDIKEKSREIENIINSMQEGLLLIDDEFEIILSNSRGLSAFNITSLENVKNITHLYRNDEFINALKRCRSKRTSSFINLTAKDMKVYRIYISPVDDNGFVILTTDVTELIRLEKVRSDFVANVSHELKTPITSISGFAELIDKGMVGDPSKIKSYAHKIFIEAQRLISLIDDILLLSKLENNSKPVYNENNIREIFDSILELLSPQIQTKKINVSIKGEAVIFALYDHIYELVLNLTENAIKYNNNEGSIDIEIFEINNVSGFTIRNTGPLIPPEQFGRIFERFYRVDTGRSRKTGGTGLGLSIVKHIVELYKGNVYVRNDNDANLFTILLNKTLKP